MIRADFHCHTHYSHDCFAGIGAVLDCARRRGLTHLAITDHDALDGAFRARDRSRDVQIIIGCEVSLTGGGHLIGLFLERPITGKTKAEVVDEIHAQGGFVLVPHPLNEKSGLFGGARFGVPADAQKRVPPVGSDAIEVVNGHEPPAHNIAAAELARQHGLPMLAGSDAHYGVDVGRACVEFLGADTLTAELLRTGKRTLWTPAEDLSAIHAADSQIRATTAPRARKFAPQAARTVAKWLVWQRCRRQIQARLHEPVRQEFRG
jgi:predicted metal-dependent phosphoesterase TrpH